MTERPFDEERPAEEIPPLKEEVPVPCTAMRLVVVALVTVALRAVTFWSVVEPVTRRFAKVARPVSVREATVSVPIVPVWAKRFVEEAVEAKRAVEVLLVVVLWSPVKFWSVLLPVTRRLARVARPEEERVPRVD